MDNFDIHPHVISADKTRYPLNPHGGQMSPWVVARPVTAEQMVEEMDAAGIRRSVLVQASTAYAFDNSYAADSAAAHPDRFASVGSVDVRSADAPAQLRYWIRERGMNGLRIFTSGSAMADDDAWLDDPATFPAWQAAVDLNISVSIQMKAGGYARLPTLLKLFPSVPVILDHLSHPTSADGPPYAAAASFWELSKAPNVYLKLTAHNFKEFNEGLSTSRSFIQKCVDNFGARRIAWGSNFPSSAGPLKKLLELAQSEIAFLPETDRLAIMRDTALTLYPILGSAVGSRN
jgi:L-fuconolactonase